MGNAVIEDPLSLERFFKNVHYENEGTFSFEKKNLFSLAKNETCELKTKTFPFILLSLSSSMFNFRLFYAGMFAASFTFSNTSFALPVLNSYSFLSNRNIIGIQRERGRAERERERVQTRGTRE